MNTTTINTIKNQESQEMGEERSPGADMGDRDTGTIHQPWEAQEGWTYMGHGEWVQSEDVQGTDHGTEIQREPCWVQHWMAKQDEDIARHDRVMKGGYPNRWGHRR